MLDTVLNSHAATALRISGSRVKQLSSLSVLCSYLPPRSRQRFESGSRPERPSAGCCDDVGVRVGLIADVHGNVVALRAVLDDVAKREVDSLVCLGDIAANGPQPTLAVEMVQALDCPVVLGNTDEAMLNVPEWWRDPASVGAPDTAGRVVAVSAWCADQLGPGHLGYLSGLPETVEVDLGAAGSMLCFHGSPRSSTDIISSTTPDDELAEMVHGAGQRFLAGGHTHVPLVRRLGDQTIINPGSVGLPFARYGFAGEVEVLNHASYGIIETQGASVGIEVIDVPIDRDALAQAVESSGMPHGDWWLSQRLRDPA